MSENILKYNREAENIYEATPVSNGVIGGMIYGKAVDDVIKLNIDSFWSGKLLDRVNLNSLEGIEEVRKLMAEGKYAKAEKTAVETMQGTPSAMRRFMPFLDFHLNSIIGYKIKNYTRRLDLETAVCTVEFDAGTKHYTRRYICTADEGLVVDFSCSEDESISLEAWLDGKEEFCTANVLLENDRILYTGGIGGTNGINFSAVVAVKTYGGEQRMSGSRISIRNADSVMLIFSAMTDVEIDIEEATEILAEHMDDADGLEFDEIAEGYGEWYTEAYSRVELRIDDGGQENLADMATDKRIERLRGDKLDSKECTRLINDNGLVELYFNFGRYLMITAGTSETPLSACGLWNAGEDTQYRYNLAGSMQMCYWAADVCGINECFFPLFRFIKRIEKNGRQTAENMYGLTGSVCHTAADFWGDTAPNGTSADDLWCMGLAWLALHIFEHYEYIVDRDFLKKNYLVMRNAAIFFARYLRKNDSGKIAVIPTVSPTSEYIAENGEKAKICSGSSIDAQILTVLFRNVIKACGIAGIDDKFTALLQPLLKRLPEIETGKYGQIKEWLEDYDEVTSSDKLLYHLFGLFPSDLITPAKTPKLAAAARTTLIRRLIHGGLDKGFGCAWTANMWARLYDGNMVYENIKNLLTLSTAPNLICNYPDFRVDVNMGAVSAVAECLLQSTNGEIVLLPALPDEWKSGEVRGLRAKGGFEVSMEWENGRLKGAEIISKAGMECRIRVTENIALSIICEDEDISPRMENGAVVFSTTKDTSYIIRC